MQQTLNLQWGMPHMLNLSATAAGVYGQLTVIKANGTQYLHFFIKDATVEDFKTAWEAQESNWNQLWSDMTPVFRAMRVIRSPKWEITWSVVHYQDNPTDTLIVTLL